MIEDSAIIDRFWSKVDKGGDCWEWTAAISHGYGAFKVGAFNARAHRFSYELTVGPIPDGYDLHHTCHNRSCVNPRHLVPMTRKEHLAHHPDNARAGGQAIGAIKKAKTHCDHGHEFTPENTYTRPDGRRKCRACNREGEQRRREVAAHA